MAVARGEPRELALAREGLSPAERRAAVRAVRRGRVADDPGAARLAVAVARNGLRGSEYLPLQLVVALITGLGFAAECIASAAHHGVDGETVVSGVIAALTLSWFVRGFHRSDRWRRAEAANRAALEHAGLPFVEDTTSVPRARPPLARLLLGMCVQWAVTDLTFGAFSQASRGGAFTLGHLVRSGLIFSSVLTAWTLLDTAFPRWRTWLPRWRDSRT